MRRKFFHGHSCNGSFLNGLKVNSVFTTDDEKLEITRSHLPRWKQRRETGSRLHFMVTSISSNGEPIRGSNDTSQKRRKTAVVKKSRISRQSLLKRWCIFVTSYSQRALSLSVVLTIECCRLSVIGVYIDHIWSFICHIPGSVVNTKPFYCEVTSSIKRCVQVA